VLRGNLRMPGDVELEQLAGILESWRQIFLHEQILLHRRELQDSGLAALRTLTNVISEIAKLDESNFYDAARESAPRGILRYLCERLAESSGARALAERVSAVIFRISLPARQLRREWVAMVGRRVTRRLHHRNEADKSVFRSAA
jgi:hypothetical protein